MSADQSAAQPEPTLPRTTVEYALAGEEVASGVRTARIVAWLTETDDPARVQNTERRRAHRTFFVRATTTFEQVTLEEAQRR